MNLPAPLAIALRTLADWLDDRLTIAAIGLATGYFGLGDAQWGAISNWVVGTATVVLVLVPDPRKRETKNNDLPPIELQGRADAGDAGVDPGALRAADVLRQSLSSDRDSGGVSPPGRESGGWNG